MDFINRGFSSILFIALSFIAILFLINVLPIVLLVGAGVWGISYIVKAIRRWNNNRTNIFKRKASKFEKVEAIQKDFSENINLENVVDVDYTEVK
jgi:hypothetical protein